MPPTPDSDPYPVVEADRQRVAAVRRSLDDERIGHDALRRASFHPRADR